MTDRYDDDVLAAVARSCAKFSTGGLLSMAPVIAVEQVSCRVCRHWDGEKCDIDVFDAVLSKIS